MNNRNNFSVIYDKKREQTFFTESTLYTYQTLISDTLLEKRTQLNLVANFVIIILKTTIQIVK